MSEHDESDDIFIPTPEEIDEADVPKGRRHRREGQVEPQSTAERRGIGRLLRRVRGDVGRNRVRAPAPPPVRPSRSSQPDDEPPPPPADDAATNAPPTTAADQAAPQPYPLAELEPEPTPKDEPEDTAPTTPQPPRLRKVHLDRVPRRYEPADRKYESPNGAPRVRELAAKMGHVLGDFKTEWDGNNRIESARCVNCGEWGHAIFEVADGWGEDTAYPQYKGRATNTRCPHANGG